MGFMNMKKVELLAPAGNYQAFLGALYAGADAVYLGGDKFSARAYADNFSEEEICEAIRYAHFFGKKVYLTVNTLVKEKEFSSLYDYISPFYEAGLDGVIIQDLGVFQYIRETFPGMALHASTQMTITGTMGALFLKEIGAARIVPARELSLTEIKKMKAESGLELECFIHGAMCYCYSGQCLFSSILGGRSGNRGRCAQPCRLPYKVLDERCAAATEQLYPLSLKDMCTIEFLPKLIEAGIDSFKIEGRMKKPEYAAGVTAIYRKYIDGYYENFYKKSQTDSVMKSSWHVEKPDMDRLRKLYIRSGIQTGYYERRNGREMITLHQPGYAGSDESLLQETAERYIREMKCPVTITADFHINEPSMLRIEGAGVSQVSYGETPQRAQKRPMTKEEIEKQLRKTGNSYVTVTAETITADEDVFIPVKQLNELRREAVAAFEEQVIAKNGFERRRRETPPASSQPSIRADSSLPPRPQLHVSIQTLEQLQAVCRDSCGKIERIYIDSDFYMQNIDRLGQYVEKCGNSAIFLALPYVIRESDNAYFRELTSLLQKNEKGAESGSREESGKRKKGEDRGNHSRITVKGFLVRNLESFYYVHSLNASKLECLKLENLEAEYLKSLKTEETKTRETKAEETKTEETKTEKTKTEKKYEIVTDAGIYCFNAETFRFLSGYGCECYLPYELNAKECRRITAQGGRKLSMSVYGTIPMMLTANCLQKTTGSCLKNNRRNLRYLQDRYQTNFPVLCDCLHCYNIIYNSVPYSLHQKREELENMGLSSLRLDFVPETGEQAEKILDFYTGKSDTFPITEYTTGHYKRGID